MYNRYQHKIQKPNPHLHQDLAGREIVLGEWRRCPQMSFSEGFVWNTKLASGPRDDVYPSPAPTSTFLPPDTTS